MKKHLVKIIGAIVPLAFLAIINAQLSTLRAQGTAFTYQGRLNDGGGPANGSYDLRFSLWTTNTGGTMAYGFLTNSATGVSNGLFTVGLDFGSGAFDGTAYWLQIGVRTNGGGAFTDLSPRQQLTPSPYSIFAEGANAAGLSGTIPSGAFSGNYTNPVTFNNGSDEYNGTFSGQFFGPLFVGGSFSGAHFGDGSGLYNLNPAELSGPIPTNLLVNAWKTTGNAGTIPGVNFVGTSDNQPLEVHVNSQRAFQFLPDASTNNAPDIVGGSPSNALTGALVGTTISGGAWNTIGPPSLFVTNNPYGDTGAYPALGASYSTIGGGFQNQIQAGATFSTVAGGAINTIQDGVIESTISGGFGNSIVTNGSWSTIAGGTHHTIGSQNGFIGGGWNNIIQTNSGYSVIGGGLFNANQGNVIAGFIGGGYENTIGPDGISGFYTSYSVIGGGVLNSIHEYDSFIGGGQQNQIQAFADHSAIGGGAYNTIVGSLLQPLEAAVIGGGQNNVIQTNTVSSVIGGGYGNTIQSNALYAVIPGGYTNIAGGSASFAAGSFAQATNNGAFVWSDTSSTNVFNSTGSNQFLIRATGGVGIGTNSPAAALHVVGNGGGTNIALRVENGGIAVSGAGIETATPAFIHVANSTNTSTYVTYIYNPICDNDPNAILLVTHSFNPPNGSVFNYDTHPFSVWYAGPHWTIYHDDFASISNQTFNVLVIKR